MTAPRILSTAVLIAAVLVAQLVEAASEQIDCPPNRAGASSSQPLATVQRIDAERVLIAWSIPGPVDVLIAADPAANSRQARVLARAVRNGCLVTVSSKELRDYFLLRAADGGRVVRAAERLLPLAGASNLRDLGGYITADGRQVRWGKIYRSGAMPLLTDTDLRYLEDAGIQTIIDLRADEERELAPDRRARNMRYHTQSYSFSAVEDAYRASLVHKGEPDASFYGSFLTLLAPQFGAIFRDLLRGSGAVLYHCTAGQDRTGVASALVLAVLGVPRDTILEDYRLSTAMRRPGNEMPEIDPRAFPHNRLAESAARTRLMQANPLDDADGRTRLEDIFATIDLRYGGSVDRYVIDVLGLTAADLAQLRERLLESRPRIVRVIRRDETITHLDPSVGADGLTWAADDRQFIGSSDGADVADPPRFTFHSRVFALLGDPPRPTIEDLPGYPATPWRETSDKAQYWGLGCLAADGRIYQLLMTSNHAYLRPDTSHWPGFRMAGAKLIYSPDNGKTWHNQDGSRLLEWERWEQRSRKNMLFFDEQPAGAFTAPTFLQMGRNYELNRDGFIYVYSMNGDDGIAARRLVMLRVPKAMILDRSAYEFFAGMRSNGVADWHKDIGMRRAVHTFPAGWTRGATPGDIPRGWNVDVVYNGPLDLYMMVANGTGEVSGYGGGSPNYLGVWVSATPWGPFTQIHEEREWTPGGDRNARAFMPRVAPKWIAPDGRSFWLVWADNKLEKGTEGQSANLDVRANDMTRGIVDDEVLAPLKRKFWREHVPNFGMNMQRVDLIVE